MLKITRTLFLVAFLVFLGSLAFAYFQYTAFTSTMISERKAQVHMLSESAMGVIQRFHRLTVGSGALPDAQAQAYAMQALQSATYGEDGYFWINDLQGKMLMHPHKPELVGVNLYDRTDEEGTYLFREFISTARAGGGWVKYMWPKPNSTESYSKLSYVDHFEPWGWVLGSGVYLDDMEGQIFREVAKASGLLFLLFSAFVAGAVLWIDFSVKRLDQAAVRDNLTRLYTKRFLNEVAPNILRNRKRLKDQILAAIFMDIDHFKSINDNYGHSIGDKVLRRLGEVVTENTRPNDICIRYGGEEVLVLGFYASLEAAAQAAERIRVAFANQTFDCNGTKFSATLSAGVAEHNVAVNGLDDTIEKADQKMYESKGLGRNRVSK